MNTTSESLLLRLKKAEDQHAWSRFVQLYTPLLFYWARKTGLQSQDASDLVQEILTVLFRKIPEFNYDPKKSFRSWLRTVTLNKYREFCRRKSVSRMAATGSIVDHLPDQRLSPESTWDLNYHRSLFITAMNELESEFRPKTWAAVRKFVLENRPAAEISEETGVSVWTIYAAKSRLFGAIARRIGRIVELNLEKSLRQHTNRSTGAHTLIITSQNA